MLKATLRPAELLTMMYWLRYEIKWVIIDSENYPNMKF